jgi:hypothetical protein
MRLNSTGSSSRVLRSLNANAIATFSLQIEEDEFYNFMMSLDNDKAIDEFVDGLTSVNIFLMSNEDPDIRVLNVLDESHLKIFIGDCFGDGDGVIQMIIENGNKDHEECTHFRLFLQGYGPKNPINYKLETFLRMIKVKGIASRCDKAVVVGLDGPMGNMVNIPHELAIGFVPDVGTMVAVEVFDCLGECLSGTMIWEIMRYLRHPVADIMIDHIEESGSHCSFYLAWMFELDFSGL